MTGMNPYLALGIAIATEVVATSLLRTAEGFTKPVPSALVIAGYVISFYLLTIALKAFPLGTTYAIWSGVGTAATALVSWLIFKDHLTPITGVGIALVIVGVVVMQLSGAHR